MMSQFIEGKAAHAETIFNKQEPKEGLKSIAIEVRESWWYHKTVPHPWSSISANILLNSMRNQRISEEWSKGLLWSVNDDELLDTYGQVLTRYVELYFLQYLVINTCSTKT